MLARFFHAWERRIAFSTKDRVERPFDWGTDWISGASAVNGSAGALVDPMVALRSE